MKCAVLLLAIAALCLAKPQWFELNDYTFEKYIRDFNKHYDPQESEFRKQIFADRLKNIKQHNELNTMTWKKGVNHMSDWTPAEFGRLLGYNKKMGAIYRNESNVISIPQVDIKALPTHVDWRDRGVVSPVKDQGQCGSCWSFGTTETIESFFALKTGQLSELSEQQILDCTPNPNQCGGTGGCGGGTPELAYAKIMQMGGLSSEWTYPYTSWYGANAKCDNQRVTTVATLSGYRLLKSNEYAPVLTAVATLGPLAINVDASSWVDYESGVFDGCNQTSPDIDHVVQLVGYGTDPFHGDYWLVRNSWTPGFGEKGYIRLRRQAIPRCGIDTHPSDGTGCNGGPSQVKVCGTCGILYDVSYPLIKND